jgi:hypothetical protein
MDHEPIDNLITVKHYFTFQRVAAWTHLLPMEVLRIFYPL